MPQDPYIEAAFFGTGQLDPDKASKINALYDIYKSLAYDVIALVPESLEQRNAVDRLRESALWAAEGIVIFNDRSLPKRNPGEFYPGQES